MMVDILSPGEQLFAVAAVWLIVEYLTHDES